MPESNTDYTKSPSDIRVLTNDEITGLKTAATWRYWLGVDERGYPDGRDFAILCLLKTMEEKGYGKETS